MSESISASPAQADATRAADNNPSEPAPEEAVFAVMTAMTDYFASTWEKSEELRTLHRERLVTHYGWSGNTIARFKVGFDDGGVVEHLKGAGFTREQILSTGAFKTDSYNIITSRFTGRIVFPYLDAGDITRYFTGRETSLTPRWVKDGKDITPKYVKLGVHKDGEDDGISPAVQNVIWTTHGTVKTTKFGIIAEGVADAISAGQAGYAVRSPVTTTFKEADAEEIDQLTSGWEKIVLVPDMEANRAGITGALKTSKILIEKGRDVRIGILPHEDIKAAAEARVEELRKARIGEGKLPTEEEIKKAGDWKIDLNELLAAPAEVKTTLARLAELKGCATPENDEDKTIVEEARGFVKNMLGTIRVERTEALRVLVHGARPALAVMIDELPDETTPNDWATSIREVTETISLITDLAEREAWLDRLKMKTRGRLPVLRNMVEQEREDEDEADAEEENPLIPILHELKFFRTLTGRVFTVVEGAALPVDGEEFGAWLSNRCLETTKKVVGPTAIRDSIRAVVGVTTKLPLGVAPIRYGFGKDGSIWIDLADKGNHYVHVTASTIRIEKHSPVAFYRPANTGAMPLPEIVEKIEVCQDVFERVFAFLAVSEKSRVGLFAVMMSAMRPMEIAETGALTTYTVGVFTGEHGSGKTSRQRFVRRLIDPREPASMKMPESLDDLTIYCENSAAVSLDNQSVLKEIMSDGLCRVATGDGAVKRSLYTNRDLAVFRGSRPILVNGIVDVVTRDDLLDRAIVMSVERPEVLKTDAQLEAEFVELWPTALGALCFCMMESLGNHDAKVDTSIRMLQAAQWAAGSEVAAGFEEGSVEQAYLSARQEAVAIAADDPFVTAFLAVIGGDWKNTVTILTQQLVVHVEERDPVTGRATKRPPKDFPTTTPRVRSMLKRKMPVLRAMGVEVVRTAERTEESSKATLLHFTRKNVETPKSEPTPMNGVHAMGVVDYGPNPLDDV